jgi:hypothetical protein
MPVDLCVIKVSDILELGFLIKWQSELPNHHYQYCLHALSLLACCVFKNKAVLLAFLDQFGNSFFEDYELTLFLLEQVTSLLKNPHPG